MFNYEDEDDEDQQMDKLEEMKRKIIEKSKREFIKGCYDAYELLATKGEDAIHGTKPKELQNAINRMMSLFLIKEEYERCEFLKKFATEHIPGFEITPDKSVANELSL
jgi:hypothetical protein